MLRLLNIKELFMKKQRAFLKWAGGKGKLLENIFSIIPKSGKRLVEPFCGSGIVFINGVFHKHKE